MQVLYNSEQNRRTIMRAVLDRNKTVLWKLSDSEILKWDGQSVTRVPPSTDLSSFDYLVLDHTGFSATQAVDSTRPEWWKVQQLADYSDAPAIAAALKTLNA